MKRVELADQLQGIDYVYTVQGWLKAINHADQSKEPGRDGASGQPNAAFAPDAFGMTMEYFSGDYTRSGTGIASMATGNPTSYDGRLSAVSWQSQKTAVSPGTNLAAYAYQYDKKYQLTQASWGTPNFTSATPTFTASESFKEYGLAYDAHGNLLNLQRNNALGSLADNFTYQYTTANTNRLSSVGGYGRSYSYDLTGQLSAETGGALSKYLSYDASGLVKGVYSDAARSHLRVGFGYDEAGQRVSKVSTGSSGTNTAYYVRDGAGNVMAIYEQLGTGSPVLKELPLYGLDRLGTYLPVDGSSQYELKDHLGGVRSVLLRNKSAAGLSQVYTLLDYYPFGSLARAEGVGGNYRYQGAYAEKDAETDWNSFELRMYDARMGRWLGVDPYGQYSSPYLGIGNDPANSVDPDGGFSLADGPRVGSRAAARTTMQVSFGSIGASLSSMASATIGAMGRALAAGDHWAHNGGGEQYGRFVAGMNPLVAASNLYTGARQGTDIYGDAMSRSDMAFEAAALLPVGRLGKVAGVASRGVKLMTAARSGRTVYRAVSKAELRDTAKYGFRLNSNYNTGKLFAETAKDASKFGKGFDKYRFKIKYKLGLT